jgi:Na+/H+ antiporter NhaD/arsenite permease-like protein
MLYLIAFIVLLTYIAIAIGQIPSTRMNRATIALVGAITLVIVGSISGLFSEHDALTSIDMGTILLLGAMMVLNVNLQMAGFFGWITHRVLRIAKTPRLLLAMLMLASGVLSALFLNDTICLMLTPLIADITLRLKRNPVPYLISLCISANIGSVATITGNPQNLIIGQASQISYAIFALYLTPIAIVSMLVAWVIIVWVYREEFTGTLPTLDLEEPMIYRPLMNRVIPIVGLLLVGFFVGLPIVTVACVGAGMLLVSRIRPQKLLQLDWELLAMFAGLFVVTGAIEKSGLSALLFSQISPLLQSGIVAFTGATAVLSNLVSNVPAVLLFRPEIPNFANPERTWLVLAMASTLAGNFTLLGSAASLIVAELARTRGIKISFGEFLKVGVPITIFTLIIGVLWLSVA